MTELCVEQRKVRVRHRCVWCGEWIEPGETAHFHKVIFDGEFQNNYYHPECWTAMLEEDFYDECFDPYLSPRGGHIE